MQQPNKQLQVKTIVADKLPAVSVNELVETFETKSSSSDKQSASVSNQKKSDTSRVSRMNYSAAVGKKSKHIIGSVKSSSTVTVESGVLPLRTVDKHRSIFVSRLQPEVTVSEVTTYLNQSGIASTDFDCQKLNSRA
ncbi:uncharacterized protein LOC120351311 [Nilaparvata lugens]|uniref:uncharacterized protein LOC120351311 n=1 Tax=Nilaparvata lugens TaxID=108931 RepID=UPI00193E474A|nr:uncharacterized protein LOC120351311 [Nilaparvata lugens]